MSLENDIDVIDFYRPIGNAHSVYVSSLLVDFDSIPQLEVCAIITLFHYDYILYFLQEV